MADCEQGTVPVPPGKDAAGQDADWFCKTFPDWREHLFAQLDLTDPAMATVASLAEDGDWPAACRALLAHYRDARVKPFWQAEFKRHSHYDADGAERMLKGEVYALNLWQQLPSRPDGGWDWCCSGLEETGVQNWVARQGMFGNLVVGYFTTGESRLLRAYESLLGDWIAITPQREWQAGDVHENMASIFPWGNWLDVSIRMRFWARAFFMLLDDGQAGEALLLLMLSRVPEHGAYLNLSRLPTYWGNHCITNMVGLVTVVAAWPEFKEVDTWTQTAMAGLEEAIEHQCYPDGAQVELSWGYHGVVQNEFEEGLRMLKAAGLDAPAVIGELTEAMAHFAVWLLLPDGTNPMNGDSMRGGAVHSGPVRKALEAAGRYDRPEWAWIATNGQEGQKPDGLPSCFFPWAGIAVFRSNFKREAWWSFFDNGPWGVTGHRHFDKLHVGTYALGREFLVDSGVLTYAGSPMRHYFVGSTGHNVILVDDTGQAGNTFKIGDGFSEILPGLTEEPLSEDCCFLSKDYCHAYGRLDDAFCGVAGTVSHVRGLFYLDRKFWVVVDRIETDRPRTIEALWHFHPDCTVQPGGRTVRTEDPGRPNQVLTPVNSDIEWSLECVRGRKEPSPQGWYSEQYNSMVESTTAVYKAMIPATATFAWIIAVQDGPAPKASGTVLSVDGDRVALDVSVAPHGSYELELPLSGAAEPRVRGLPSIATSEAIAKEGQRS